MAHQLTTHEIQARLFLRRSHGRTLVGGVLAANLCADGIDRIMDGHVILITSAQWRAYLRDGVQCLAGCELAQILTGDAFNSPNLDNSGWIRELGSTRPKDDRE